MVPTLDIIVENLERVLKRIERAAARSGRAPESVRLVAVSKGFGQRVIRLAHQAGLRDIGENRVEEAEAKQAALEGLQDLRWHMIGTIQSRKAEKVVAAFGMVHSVDRLKIARLLDRHAGAAGVRLPVLLECNVSGEATKAGWPLAASSIWDAAMEDFKQIVALPHLEVGGLMTMAPLTADPEHVRPVFHRLSELRSALEVKLGCPLPELSMGMTDDFEVAVEEGATLVRIGRALFGPRPSG